MGPFKYTDSYAVDVFKLLVSPKAAVVALIVVAMAGLYILLPVFLFELSVLYYAVLFLSFYMAVLFVRMVRPVGRLSYILVGLLGAVIFGALYNFGMRFNGMMIGVGVAAFPALAMGLSHFLLGFFSAWITSRVLR